MHPARLSFLGYKHAPQREVVSCVRNTAGHWDIKLACGHETGCVGHMDASLSKTFSCSPCGLEYVKNAPQYAKEFNA